MSDSQNLLDLFEARFQAFGKRIADYADLSLKCDTLGSLVEKLKTQLDALEGDYKDELVNISYKEGTLQKFDDYLQEQIKTCFKKIDDGFLQQSDLLRSFDSLKRDVTETSSFQTELNKKLSASLEVLSYLNKKHNELTTFCEKLQMSVQTLTEDFRSLKAHVDSLKEGMSTLSKESACHSQSLRSLSIEIDSMKSEVEKMAAFIYSKVDQKVSSALSEVDQKIKSIQIPDVSGFLNKHDLEEFRHQMSLASLDAKNSVSRTNNNEMQLQLLSKRIEGILIKMKSQELIES